MTEDEKKAKLEELRERLAAKRAVQSVKDKEDQKRNEVSESPINAPNLNLTYYSKSDKSPPRRAKRLRRS